MLTGLPQTGTLGALLLIIETFGKKMAKQEVEMERTFREMQKMADQKEAEAAEVLKRLEAAKQTLLEHIHKR